MANQVAKIKLTNQLAKNHLTALEKNHLALTLSTKMTADFGRGFTTTNLKYMRQFYLVFPNRHTLCDQLSWSHYRLLMRVADDKARQFYMDEAVKSNYSVRQLERQINSFFYERLLSSHNKEAVADNIHKVEPGK